jgi:nucleoside-diphosphate-sugar epimerase
MPALSRGDEEHRLMPRALVTGVAGFIGSHLAESLLADGIEVVGIDRFSDYYDPAIKRRHAALLAPREGFRLVEDNLLTADLGALLDGVDVVFHLAGQPGVRKSWGETFAEYLDDNVLATQRLLEACRGRGGLQRVVYASSSSIYGDAEQSPTSERALPQPVSPYGVTKLAAEHLAMLYAKLGVPTAAVRYFTVYGPRQRPDMAFNKFIRAIDAGDPIDVFVDGLQTRDFTFVADAVRATRLASTAPVTGRAFNVGGAAPVVLMDAIRLIEQSVGRAANLRFIERQDGDARHTSADISEATRLLGFTPATPLAEGIAAQVAWQLGRGEAR